MEPNILIYALFEFKVSYRKILLILILLIIKKIYSPTVPSFAAITVLKLEAIVEQSFHN